MNLFVGHKIKILTLKIEVLGENLKNTTSKILIDSDNPEKGIQILEIKNNVTN